jgi:hypothetical protein
MVSPRFGCGLSGHTTIRPGQTGTTDTGLPFGSSRPRWRSIVFAQLEEADMGVTEMLFVVGLPVTCIALLVAYWYRNRGSFQFGHSPKRQSLGSLPPATSDAGSFGGFDGGAGCGGDGGGGAC